MASKSKFTRNVLARKRSLQWIAATLVGSLALLSIFVIMLMRQVDHVRAELSEVARAVPELISSLESEDPVEARRILHGMSGNVASARSTASGPIWRIASNIPMVGTNFSAVKEVSVSADDVVNQAIEPLIEVSASLAGQSFSLNEGRLDLVPIQEAAPSLTSAANVVRLSADRLDRIDLESILPAVAEPISSARDELRGASQALSSLSSVATLLPDMLGASEPRRYLILVQNSAEARATGGIPGAVATLTASEGMLALESQTSASALGGFSPRVSVDQEQVALFTGRLGTVMQNVNLTPDFPTAASTAKTMWEIRNPDEAIDGVVAVDPVVLGHMLRATGPIELDDVEVLQFLANTELPSSLTENNVVPTLLSEVYKEIQDPSSQDAYFAAVASEIFEAFTKRGADGSQMISAVNQSMGEGRLFLWSSHGAEQSVISKFSVAGGVTGAAGGGAGYGIFFNDGTGAKMDFYAKRTVQLIENCPSDAYNRHTVRISITNTAPLDASESLPAWVTGGGKFGVPAGNIRTNYVVYGPSQSLIASADVNGQPVSFGAGKHQSRPVGTVTVELAPNESAFVDFTFHKVVQNSEPTLRVTPTVDDPDEVVLDPKKESCS